MVNKEFAAMGIKDWRNHATLVADKEAVDAQLVDIRVLERRREKTKKY